MLIQYFLMMGAKKLYIYPEFTLSTNIREHIYLAEINQIDEIFFTYLQIDLWEAEVS